MAKGLAMFASILNRLTQGRVAAVLLAALAIIGALPQAMLLPPLDRDESRFMQATVQMFETDDFVNISFQDQPRHKKPIGIHWLQAAAVSALGHDEDPQLFDFRLPSLLALGLAVYLLARAGEFALRRRVGLLAGGALGFCLLASVEGGIAKTDSVLSFTVVAMMTALLRLYLSARDGRPEGRFDRLQFWLALALSVLVKGPIGPMLPVLTLLALWIWDRRSGENSQWIAKLGYSWGLGLVLLINLPWAVAISVETHGAFWSKAVGGDLASKVSGGSEGHFAWPGTYLISLIAAFFPFAAFLPGAAVYARRTLSDPITRFCLCWLIPSFVVFELVPTKLAHYPLPTYGALALLCVASVGGKPAGWGVRLVGGLLGIVAAAAFLGLFVSAGKSYGDIQAQGFGAATGAAGLIGAIAVCLLSLQRQSAAALGAAMATGLAFHAGLGVYARHLEKIWLSQRIADLVAQTSGIPAGTPLAVAGYAEPSLVFLMGTRTQLLAHGAEAADAYIRGEPVVVAAKEMPAFQSRLVERGRIKPQSAGQIDGLNYSSGKPAHLTLFAPMRP